VCSSPVLPITSCQYINSLVTFFWRYQGRYVSRHYTGGIRDQKTIEKFKYTGELNTCWEDGCVVSGIVLCPIERRQFFFQDFCLSSGWKTASHLSHGCSDFETCLQFFKIHWYNSQMKVPYSLKRINKTDLANPSVHFCRLRLVVGSQVKGTVSPDITFYLMFCKIKSVWYFL
jgi:hypothetical protein